MSSLGLRWEQSMKLESKALSGSAECMYLCDCARCESRLVNDGKCKTASTIANPITLSQQGHIKWGRAQETYSRVRTPVAIAHLRRVVAGDRSCWFELPRPERSLECFFLTRAQAYSFGPAELTQRLSGVKKKTVRRPGREVKPPAGGPLCLLRSSFCFFQFFSLQNCLHQTQQRWVFKAVRK